MRPKQQQPIPDVEKEESNIPLLPEYTPTSSLPVATGVSTINDDNPIILFHFSFWAKLPKSNALYSRGFSREMQTRL